MKKILFVCTGNICRSPSAEAIARHLAKINNLENEFIFDSAGIEAFHVGELPDKRSMQAGEKRGVSFAGIRARQIKKSDFDEFDYLFAMDRSHYQKLLSLGVKQRAKIKLLLEFCACQNLTNDEVVDPYYGNLQGFEEIFEVINNAVTKLLEQKLCH